MILKNEDKCKTMSKTITTIPTIQASFQNNNETPLSNSIR